MFFVPPWVTFLVAAAVSLFGAYRLYIAFTSDAEALKQRKGLYGLPKRTHLLFGILYLLLGVFLVSTALGYNPFRSGDDEKKDKPQWIEVPASTGSSGGNGGAAGPEASGE